MRLLDKITILAKPGNGGDGSCSYYSYAKKNIYDGGDGGNGGNIIITTSTRYCFLPNQNLCKYSAENGYNGSKGMKTGRSGQDLIIELCRNVNLYFKTPNDEYTTAYLNGQNSYITIRGGIGGVGSKSDKNTKELERYMGEKKHSIKIECEAIINSEMNIIVDTSYSNAYHVLNHIYKKDIKIDEFMILSYKDIEIILFVFLKPYMIKQINNAKYNILIYDDYTKDRNVSNLKNTIRIHFSEIDLIDHYISLFHEYINII